MTTLDEFRKMLRQGIGVVKVRNIRQDAPLSDEDLEGEADHLGMETPPLLDLGKMKKSKLLSSLYGSIIKPTADGKDGMFLIGKHKKALVTDVAWADPDYLNWAVKTFRSDKTFIDIVNYVTSLEPKIKPFVVAEDAEISFSTPKIKTKSVEFIVSDDISKEKIIETEKFSSYLEEVVDRVKKMGIDFPPPPLGGIFASTKASILDGAKFNDELAAVEKALGKTLVRKKGK